MQINIIHTLPEMQALAGEWNALLRISASDVPFLRSEYLIPWWQTLGGGEWSSGQLYVVTARQASGALAGIAPLFFTTNREGEPALMLLGSIEISDFLDLIAPPAELPAFIEALLDHLAQVQDPVWSVLDWYNFLDSSPTLPLLQDAAVRRGWSYSQEPLQHCPYIPLPGDWETYLAGIDSKQRHEIRRKMRRAEASYWGPVRWYIVQDESALDAEVDAFLKLMAHDRDKARFLTEKMRQQWFLSMREAFRAGWLQLAFLEADGTKAAGYANFDYNGRIWVYNSGIDFNFRDLSPGWVLLGYLLQWANDNKRTEFDFMRGNEDYKYRFGGADRQVFRVQIRRQA